LSTVSNSHDIGVFAREIHFLKDNAGCHVILNIHVSKNRALDRQSIIINYYDYYHYCCCYCNYYYYYKAKQIVKNMRVLQAQI